MISTCISIENKILKSEKKIGDNRFDKCSLQTKNENSRFATLI